MIDTLEEEMELQARHMAVLRAVIANEPIGIVSLAAKTGYPHYEVRYSLRLLEEAEIIEPTPQGAVTTPTASEFLASYNDRLDAVIDRVTQLRTDNPAVP